MYRKYELDISCTFYAPILYTVQVIQPGTFPGMQEMSHVLYIFCTNRMQYRSYNQEHFLVCRKCHMFCIFSVPIVCSTGHTTRNISWYAENVTFSVHFLHQSYAVQVIQPGTFLMCKKCHMFCTFSVPILYSTSFDQEHFLMCRNCNMFCAFSVPTPYTCMQCTCPLATCTQPRGFVIF